MLPLTSVTALIGQGMALQILVIDGHSLTIVLPFGGKLNFLESIIIGNEIYRMIILIAIAMRSARHALLGSSRVSSAEAELNC